MEYKIQYGGLEAKENCKTRVGFILKKTADRFYCQNEA